MFITWMKKKVCNTVYKMVTAHLKYLLGAMNMTMPNERRNAVNFTRQFLVDLMNPKKTPRVPSAVRKEAYRCLKHYPGEYYMEEAAKQAPNIFGEWDAEFKNNNEVHDETTSATQANTHSGKDPG
jgi:hypothetical protein